MFLLANALATEPLKPSSGSVPLQRPGRFLALFPTSIELSASSNREPTAYATAAANESRSSASRRSHPPPGVSSAAPAPPDPEFLRNALTCDGPLHCAEMSMRFVPWPA